MNKNFRVITINGFRGILALIFVVFGIISGFIISPGWVCMHIWNYLFRDALNISKMNLLEGVILWAIIALALYAFNNKRALIGFGSYQGLSKEQIRDIMTRAKFSEPSVLNKFEKINNEFLKELKEPEIKNEEESSQEETEKEVQR